MATAVIKVCGKYGIEVNCRTLLDTCATANFITEDIANSLQLDKKRCWVPVGALNSLQTISKFFTKATIKSRHTNLVKDLYFFIVPSIAKFTPLESVNRKVLRIPHNLKLGDPNFHQSAPEQMLISAGASLSFFSVGQIYLSTSSGTDLIL